MLAIIFLVIMVLWGLYTLLGLSRRFETDPQIHGVFAFLASLIIGLKVFGVLG